MLLAGAPDEQESEKTPLDADDLDADDLEVGDLHGDQQVGQGGDGQARAWRGRYAALYVCDDYPANGHQPTWTGTGREDPAPGGADDASAREAARAERRRVIDTNKAWRSAETVRRDWLRVLLTRKTPPKGSAAFIAATLARSPAVLTAPGANDLAANLLGCTPGSYGRSRDLAALVERASDARA